MLNGIVGGDFFARPFSSLARPPTLLGGMLLIFNGAISLVAVVWGTSNILRGVISTARTARCSASVSGQ